MIYVAISVEKCYSLLQTCAEINSFVKKSVCEGDIIGMNNLILGSSGFIGRNLRKKLEQRKESVTLFDRFIDEDTRALYKNRCFCGEFSETTKFDEILEGVDRVYHLISTTIPSSNIPIVDEIRQNINPTIQLLESCVRNHVKDIIFVSSGGTVYGKTRMVPFREEDETDPICSYGIQKLMIEKYLYLYHHLYGLHYKVVRLANPYGPGQNPNGIQGAVTTFTYKAVADDLIKIYGNGKVVRDYIYIDDAIEGILNIADNKKYDVVNLGCGQGYDLIKVIQTLEDILDKKLHVEYSPGRKVDVPFNVLNIDRYNEISQHHRFDTLEEGIRKLIAYIMENK